MKLERNLDSTFSLIAEEQGLGIKNEHTPTSTLTHTHREREERDVHNKVAEKRLRNDGVFHRFNRQDVEEKREGGRRRR